MAVAVDWLDAYRADGGYAALTKALGEMSSAQVIDVVKNSGLRGVIITREGVETRSLAMGFPRVRKFRWAQIDRVILDKDAVLFELWNGTYERLPKVRDGEKLVDLLGRVAVGRGRTVTRLDR